MNRLKELRLNANLSQVELAKAAETTQRNISYWESGRVELNLYAALRLAQIFQVNVEYLAGYSDDFDIKPELSFNAPMGESLTEKERALLEAFRQLLPETQDFILRSTQGMNDGSPVKRFKNV
ncbi:MAG: helix-turn-helix transcriptional regulator [Clostridia bacterium]|nr:helix-turn-helix transcriptional regulator [Clostridia bacterium]